MIKSMRKYNINVFFAMRLLFDDDDDDVVVVDWVEDVEDVG